MTDHADERSMGNNRLLTVIGFLLIVGVAATTVWLTQADNPEAPAASTERYATTSVAPDTDLPLATSYKGSDAITTIDWDPEVGDQFFVLSCAGACAMLGVWDADDIADHTGAPLATTPGLHYVPSGTEALEVHFAAFNESGEWMIHLTDGT